MIRLFSGWLKQPPAVLAHAKSLKKTSSYCNVIILLRVKGQAKCPVEKILSCMKNIVGTGICYDDIFTWIFLQGKQ